MKGYSWLWRKPYGILTLAASGLALASCMVDGATDLHFHDTYLVIANSYFYIAGAILFLFFAFLYKSMSRLLFLPVLTWLHVSSTLPTLILILLYCSFAGEPPNYSDSSAWEQFRTFEQMHRAASVVVLVCFFAQLGFLLHILLGLLRLFTPRR